jgi:phage shock protein E
MKLKVIIALLLMTTVLAACGGTSANTTAVDAVNDEALLNLGDTVDVNTVARIKDHKDVYLLDVREQWEYDEGHIPGVTLIPMADVPARISEIPTDKEVIVTCRTGNRSSQVTDFLRQNGFDNVHNMSGGIVAWEGSGFEVVR